MQVAAAPPSSLQVNVEPLTVDVKENDADVLDDGLGGELVMVVFGALAFAARTTGLATDDATRLNTVAASKPSRNRPGARPLGEAMFKVPRSRLADRNTGLR